jgi:hypothetical protein
MPHLRCAAGCNTHGIPPAVCQKEVNKSLEINKGISEIGAARQKVATPKEKSEPTRLDIGTFLGRERATKKIHTTTMTIYPCSYSPYSRLRS